MFTLFFVVEYHTHFRSPTFDYSVQRPLIYLYAEGCPARAAVPRHRVVHYAEGRPDELTVVVDGGAAEVIQGGGVYDHGGAVAGEAEVLFVGGGPVYMLDGESVCVSEFEIGRFLLFLCCRVLGLVLQVELVLEA